MVVWTIVIASILFMCVGRPTARVEPIMLI